ncbi:MAG: hypothetical protein K0B06_07760 [Brevefilum sp.]|nr:hypothetical protein [Brevefilum sp.]
MPELDQVTLLRRFEPILRFTQGERFSPYNVDDYVKKSSLWVKKPKFPPEELISETDLTLDKLGSKNLEGAKYVYYLQFISPVNLAEMAEFRLNELREALKKREFHPTRSRLSRVGYLARMVDAAYSLMLLLRGRVPGDAMAAAVITFNKMLVDNPCYQYYGRVIQQSGWIILQYWYFYPFNNWRSGFYGANDHEADWEMVNIYCYQDEQGEVKPSWVAYASHNYTGDDLRRHWDDPELEKSGEHPVVYVGGGSHASYYQRGEYLTELGLAFLQPLVKFKKRFDLLFGKDFEKKEDSEEGFGEQGQVFTIPFVDYALGDGLSIGHGCETSWEPPVVIGPADDWVLNFRGLWGYYAQDPFSGEDAPAGPRYNRDGTVRQAWFDPLGWAGMEKVLPPIDQPEMLIARKAGIQATINTLQAEIAQLQEVHYQRGFDLEAIRNLPHLQGEVDVLNRNLEKERQALADKRRQLTVEQTKLGAIKRYGAAVTDGRPPVLRAHIKHAHQPQVKKSLRFSHLAEIWAAISIGLMMIAVVVLIVFARSFLFYGLAGLVLALIIIESAFRRRLADLVQWIAILLAIGGFLILIFQFFWVIVLAGAMITGFYMIVSNLRELFARQ